MTTIKKKSKIKAATFKAQCLKIMDQVNLYNHEVIITKHNKEVAKLVPVTSKENNKALFGYLKDSIKLKQEIISPINEKWNSI